ncbi:MAG: 3-deoxy-7-phosphoheptulonate synthase [Treponema sp.]
MNTSSLSSSIFSPHELKTLLPIKNNEKVEATREEIKKLLFSKDKRFLVIVGPCSIHDETATLDYAKKLITLQKKYSSLFYIVMRVYLEKSRTSIGWPGFLSSPNIAGDFSIEDGLKKGRSLMLQLINLGLPIAYEIVDPLVTPYFEDLISWASVGARSSSSQIYRYLASSLSYPVGFKNNLLGDISLTCDSIFSSRQPHAFLSIDDNGQVSNVCSKGNIFSHLVLRGYRKENSSFSNYDATSLIKAKDLLLKKELPLSILVDASHDNSNKIPQVQEKVFLEMLKARYENQNDMIKGCMLESFIFEGSITEKEYLETKKSGYSITDPCMSFERTEKLLDVAYEKYINLSSINPDIILSLPKIEKTKTKKIAVYTDGACSGNPGKGGWAFVIVEKDKAIYEKSGFELETTNNRMEMQAVIEVLKELHSQNFLEWEVTIYTDSSYVKNGITEWIKKWKKNGWRSSSNAPVKNQDLWLLLDSLVTSCSSLSWKWVKGHAGNKFNEICDSLASMQAQGEKGKQVNLHF